MPINASSLTLKVLGGINIAVAGGHVQMGLTQLAPPIAKLGSWAASTALVGWYQGTFLYVLLGLNDIRTASLPNLGLNDALLLAVQAAVHAFTVYKLDGPPRYLSITSLVLLGAGLALRWSSTGKITLGGEL